MFEDLHDKRISFPLSSLSGKGPAFAKVEGKALAFAGYIQNIAHVLKQSALGGALLASACEQEVRVGLDPLLEPSGSFFYPAQNHIDLGHQPDLLQKTEKGLGRYLVSLTGALRRAWHHHHSFQLDLSLPPQGFLEQFRVAEADAEAVIHQVAWELRAQGAAFLWRHLLSGLNGDIATVFEKTALDHPRNGFNGMALKSAFDQWFVDKERRDAADHLALEIIDMALLQRAYRGAIASALFRREDMRAAGLLPGGRNYLLACVFTHARYQGFACEINRAHLQHIEADIKTILEKQ